MTWKISRTRTLFASAATMGAAMFAPSALAQTPASYSVVNIPGGALQAGETFSGVSDTGATWGNLANGAGVIRLAGSTAPITVAPSSPYNKVTFNGLAGDIFYGAMQKSDNSASVAILVGTNGAVTKPVLPAGYTRGSFVGAAKDNTTLYVQAYADASNATVLSYNSKKKTWAAVPGVLDNDFVTGSNAGGLWGLNHDAGTPFIYNFASGERTSIGSVGVRIKDVDFATGDVAVTQPDHTAAVFNASTNNSYVLSDVPVNDLPSSGVGVLELGPNVFGVNKIDTLRGNLQYVDMVASRAGDGAFAGTFWTNTTGLFIWTRLAQSNFLLNSLISHSSKGVLLATGTIGAGANKGKPTVFELKPSGM